MQPRQLGHIGKASVPSLVEKLKDPSYQLLAATVLSEIGPSAVEAVPALTKLIHSKNQNTANEALLALGAHIGLWAPSRLSAVIIKELNDSKSSKRAAAAYALGRMKSKESRFRHAQVGSRVDRRSDAGTGSRRGIAGSRQS